MLVLYLSNRYLLAMGLWVIVLVAAFHGLLRYRRFCRQRSRRPIVANAGLSVAVLLAAVTAAELFVACFVDASDTFNITNVSKRWLKIHIDLERNNENFRDSSPWSKYIPSGTQRIVFLGDSFTIGHGIKRMADRFTERIAAWLEEKQPGKYRVANLGEPGWEVAQIAALAKTLLIVERADVNMIVYVYNLNDIEGHDRRFDKPREQIYAAGPTNPLFRDTYFLNWLYFRYVQFNQAGGEQSYFPLLVESYRSNAWYGVQAKLLEIKRDCAGRNAAFRLVIFPFLQKLGPDYPFREAHAKLVALCKSEQIPVLDLEPVFRAHAGESLMVSAFDAHPNERAHAIAAEAIENNLLSDLVRPSLP